MHFNYFLSQTKNKLSMAYDAQELVNPDCVTALVLFMKSWKRSHHKIILEMRTVRSILLKEDWCHKSLDQPGPSSVGSSEV